MRSQAACGAGTVDDATSSAVPIVEWAPSAMDQLVARRTRRQRPSICAARRPVHARRVRRRCCRNERPLRERKREWRSYTSVTSLFRFVERDLGVGERPCSISTVTSPAPGHELVGVARKGSPDRGPGQLVALERGEHLSRRALEARWLEARHRAKAAGGHFLRLKKAVSLAGHAGGRPVRDARRSRGREWRLVVSVDAWVLPRRLRAEERPCGSVSTPYRRVVVVVRLVEGVTAVDFEHSSCGPCRLVCTHNDGVEQEFPSRRSRRRSSRSVR